MQCTSVQCTTWSNYYLSKNIHMDSSNISVTTVPDNLIARCSTDHSWYVYTAIQSFFLLEYKTAKSLHEWVMQSVTGGFSSSLQCMGCVLYTPCMCWNLYIISATMHAAIWQIMITYWVTEEVHVYPAAVKILKW